MSPYIFFKLPVLRAELLSFVRLWRADATVDLGMAYPHQPSAQCLPLKFCPRMGFQQTPKVSRVCLGSDYMPSPHPELALLQPTLFRGVFCACSGGHARTAHAISVPSSCPHLAPLPAPVVPFFRWPHPLTVCLNPKSAATVNLPSLTLASHIFADGSC